MLLSSRSLSLQLLRLTSSVSGNVEWQDRQKSRCLVMWRSPQEWGKLIYQWVSLSSTPTHVDTCSSSLPLYGFCPSLPPTLLVFLSLPYSCLTVCLFWNHPSSVPELSVSLNLTVPFPPLTAPVGRGQWPRQQCVHPV